MFGVHESIQNLASRVSGVNEIDICMADVIVFRIARHNRHLGDAFVTRLSAILPWDAAAAEKAARIKQELAAKGTPVGSNDTMIAGHALAAECVLVTNNTREFSRVQGLRFEDWVAA